MYRHIEKQHTYSDINSIHDFVQEDRAYATYFAVNYGDEKSNYSTKRPSRYRMDMNEYLFSLTEEDLRQVALEKAPNGCATERANFAQRMLWHKAQYGCYCTC